ncbi:hypothetical protein [Microbacterium imperiale]|uniref:Uncharacterized protein n=1 Tax=Microbacterium imperiale TaxID=33884 RepID=A0A9W6HDV6_9MICO|nr:hypothetical protein [Microbacterium imperiale]MBP2419988.1 peptidoglycan/LPS O-acetylase OafA/YrhL [Microbacterium imperiale]MDS0198148.1 hypothetical protein [Microbacterium imperiale]BFE40330.1 hypothetical protein GCM10017544_12860 [Microbacterium imperiale]GLJ78694.1 hypothetical protein GCM10017586_03760 [Microbacterium imperiale]
MDIAIPVAPLGIITLLGFFAPYAVGALNGLLPFVTKPVHRKVVSVAVAVVLAGLVMVFYFAITREPVTDWWLFTLLAVVVVNASYALLTRDLGAKQLEHATEPTTARTDSGTPDISSLPPESRGGHNIH